MGDDRAIWLTATGEGGGYVEPKTLDEVAALLKVTAPELTQLQYGTGCVMFMVQATQLDRDMAPNRGALLVLERIHGLRVAPRGDVVCFPRGLPWEAPVATVEA